MTRRVIAFQTGVEDLFLLSPEYNGDKKEFDSRSINCDHCTSEWDEIIALFNTVTDAASFKTACSQACSCYKSYLGAEEEPTAVPVTYDDIVNGYWDEVWLVEPGEIPKVVDFS